MNILTSILKKGVKFVTASGAVGHLMGVSKRKVVFTLSCGTSNECKASVVVSVVDTTASHASLGMDFIKTKNVQVSVRKSGMSAPCHVAPPLLIAHACFGGLISTEAELHNVQECRTI